MGTRRKGKRRGFEEILEDYWSIQEVAARYGLKVRNYRRLGSVYRLETQDGAKRLKKFDKTERDMLFVYSACEHLACQGFDKGPNFMLSLDGHPYVQVAGDIYYVTDWVDGRECDLSNICELEAACKILAQMHLASGGFAAQGALECGGRELVPLEELFTSRMKHLYSLRESVEGRARKSKFDIRFLKYMDDFVKLGDLAMADLERSGYLPEGSPGICVRNYGPEVLVTRPDGEMRLVDMDECCLGDRLIDLGDFIRAHCEWDVDRAVFMMEVYHMVYPLTRPEASALLAYVKFPMDLWKVVTDNYYRGHEDRHAMRELVKTLDKREEFIEALDAADLGFLDIIVPNPQTYGAYSHEADRQDTGEGGRAVEEMTPAVQGGPEAQPTAEAAEAGTGGMADTEDMTDIGGMADTGDMADLGDAGDLGELGAGQGSGGDEALQQRESGPPTDWNVEEALDAMPDIPDFGLPFVVEEVCVEPWEAPWPHVPEHLVPAEEWPEGEWPEGEWPEESEVQLRAPRGHGHAAFAQDLGDLEDICDAAGRSQEAEARDAEADAEAKDAMDIEDALAPAAGLMDEAVVNLVTGEQVRAAMEKMVGLDKDEAFAEPMAEHAGATGEKSGLSVDAPDFERAVGMAGAEPEPIAEGRGQAKAMPEQEPKAGVSQPQAPASTGTLVWKAFPKSPRTVAAKTAKGDAAASGRPKAGR